MSSPLATRCHICNEVFLTTGTSDVDYLTSTLPPQRIIDLRNNAMAIKLKPEMNGAVAFRTQIAYLNLAKPVHPACKARLEATSASNASSSSSSSSSSWRSSLSPRAVTAESFQPSVQVISSEPDERDYTADVAELFRGVDPSVREQIIEHHRLQLRAASSSSLSGRAVTPLSPRPTRLSHTIDINDLDDASSSSLPERVMPPVSPRPARLSHTIDINDLDDASSSSLPERVITAQPVQPLAISNGPDVSAVVELDTGESAGSAPVQGVILPPEGGAANAPQRTWRHIVKAGVKAGVLGSAQAAISLLGVAIVSHLALFILSSIFLPTPLFLLKGLIVLYQASDTFTPFITLVTTLLARPRHLCSSEGLNQATFLAAAICGSLIGHSILFAKASASPLILASGAVYTALCICTRYQKETRPQNGRLDDNDRDQILRNLQAMQIRRS